VELKDLIGEHELSGVDMSHVSGNHSSDVAQVCRFILDGKIYTVTEDDDDGYRSMMKDIVEGGEPVINVFAPHKVLGSLQTKGEYGSAADILVFRDVVTGQEVLNVGTDNTDDYYPSFVADFQPANLACNASAKEAVE
jgi:hypothetical protein